MPGAGLAGPLRQLLGCGRSQTRRPQVVAEEIRLRVLGSRMIAFEDQRMIMYRRSSKEATVQEPED